MTFFTGDLGTDYSTEDLLTDFFTWETVTDLLEDMIVIDRGGLGDGPHYGLQLLHALLLGLGDDGKLLGPEYHLGFFFVGDIVDEILIFDDFDNSKQLLEVSRKKIADELSLANDKIAIILYERNEMSSRFKKFVLKDFIFF